MNFADYSDVWSSADGATWTQETELALFSGRYNHLALAFNDAAYVIGGFNGSATGDVWSTADGTQWTQANPAAQFQPRYSMAGTVSGGKMWLVGGTLADNSVASDVWSSTRWRESMDPGHWECVVWPALRWELLALSGKLWLIGGNGYANDVWSSPDGLTWTQATGSTAYSARTGFAAVTFNDRLWVIDGFSNSLDYLADAWSSPDGVNWTPATGAPGNGGRAGHMAAVFNGWIGC